MKETPFDEEKKLTKHDKLVVKVSESIIANQIALYKNERIKGTNRYKGMLKNRLNFVIQELVEAETLEFDKLFEAAEIQAKEAYIVTDTLIEELSALGMNHYQNIRLIIEAYRIDPNSICGIANKIKKNKSKK